jgi:hypothetical protein
VRYIDAFGLKETLASAGESGAKENHASIDAGGMKDDLSGRRRMDADPRNGYAVAQSCLETKPHRLLYPELAPGPALLRQPR